LVFLGKCLDSGDSSVERRSSFKALFRQFILFLLKKMSIYFYGNSEGMFDKLLGMKV